MSTGDSNAVHWIIQTKQSKAEREEGGIWWEEKENYVGGVFVLSIPSNKCYLFICFHCSTYFAFVFVERLLFGLACARLSASLCYFVFHSFNVLLTLSFPPLFLTFLFHFLGCVLFSNNEGKHLWCCLVYFIWMFSFLLLFVWCCVSGWSCIFGHLPFSPILSLSLFFFSLTLEILFISLCSVFFSLWLWQSHLFA